VRSGADSYGFSIASMDGMRQAMNRWDWWEKSSMAWRRWWK
jgi:hypothetical protein